MAKKKIVSTNNLRTKSPLHITLTVWLVLKVSTAPEWVWGAIGVLVLVAWISWFKDDYEEIDIFNDDKK
jgi:hypothetical protein